ASPCIRELDVPAAALRRLAALHPKRYPVLFDSAADGPLSRTSILVAEPRASLWLDSSGRVGAEGVSPRGNDFLTALENWWLDERLPASLTDLTGGQSARPRLPFVGGWALFLSYEVAQEIEPQLQLPPSSLPWRAFALRTPCALVHERATGKVFAVAEAAAADSLERLEADARAVAGHIGLAADSMHVERVTEEDPTAYLGRVIRAKEYVRAG